MPIVTESHHTDPIWRHHSFYWVPRSTNSLGARSPLSINHDHDVDIAPRFKDFGCTLAHARIGSNIIGRGQRTSLTTICIC
jgi:hypothetical protein